MYCIRYLPSCFAACHESCKSTCWEGGPKGCDECKSGWKTSEEEGCIGRACNSLFLSALIFLSLRNYTFILGGGGVALSFR